MHLFPSPRLEIVSDSLPHIFSCSEDCKICPLPSVISLSGQLNRCGLLFKPKPYIIYMKKIIYFPSRALVVRLKKMKQSSPRSPLLIRSDPFLTCPWECYEMAALCHFFPLACLTPSIFSYFPSFCCLLRFSLTSPFSCPLLVPHSSLLLSFYLSLKGGPLMGWNAF